MSKCQNIFIKIALFCLTFYEVEQAVDPLRYKYL